MKPESKALELLLDSNSYSNPVDLTKVTDFLGILVHQEPLEADTSGMLIIKDDEKHIVINKEHHTNRQRFTIAHELGHLKLHHQENKVEQLFVDKKLSVYLRSTEGEYKQEKEANAFAAALLMPKTLLQQHIEKTGVDPKDETGVTYLANAFGVSEQAMLIRLHILGFAKI